MNENEHGGFFAKARLDEDPRGRVTGLSVRRAGVDSVPSSLAELRDLRALDLSYNDVGTLPESLGTLPALTELRLDALGLSSLPASLRALTGLEVLSLYKNRLTEAPSWLPRADRPAHAQPGRQRADVPAVRAERP
ncbi:leucine-rich repeat domain-containing protein [Streptomyces tricolor]|nr:leucine-rich repeat domain-containing protein [Streptomyces tricolor]